MRGEVITITAYDVADDVRAHRVRTMLGQTPARLEQRLSPAAPRDVAFPRPWRVAPMLAARCRGQSLRAEVHLFEVGVISIVLRVAVEANSLDEWARLREPRTDAGQPFDALARELCLQAQADLADALIQPAEPTDPEAYTVFTLTDLEGVADASQWLAREQCAVAGLVTGVAPEQLSDEQVEEAIRLRRAWKRSDLSVIDWDAALIVDLEGDGQDVLDVLEVANLQLEEFRVMDRRLDRHLDEAYGTLERRPWAGSTAPRQILRTLRWLRIDLAKLADEVTHITKFFGDWHLARVYLAACERFHLDHWRGSVSERLRQLDDLYNALRGEVYERRLLWLEVIIVILFTLDLLMLFWNRH